jgi:2-polyprenyl-6-methoxyphenol hydroxylase-like FAD-dependent oxidoreductase
MFGKRKSEVLVVGAGPVGLFTALELADRGIQVEIIDGQWRTAAHSYALALHPASLELLDRLGLAEDLLGHGHRVDTVAFYDGKERRGELRLSQLSGKFPFVLVLPQQALEDAFEKRLAEMKVEVRWNHRLARLDAGGDQVTAHVDKLIKEASGYAYSATGWVVDKKVDFRADFVVGSDGLRSAVRRALDIEFPEVGARQFFGVFELDAAMSGANEVRVVLDDRTTNVLWPMRDDHFRWSFQLADDWEFVPRSRTKSRLTVQVGDEAYLFLDEDKLHELVAARAPWFDAEVGDVTWSVAVRFEKRLAESFGSGRAWLAGDAAHVAGPVGVQSMNVGFREARDLADSIQGVLHQGAPASSLGGYAGARRAEWRTLLGLDEAVRAGAGASDWVRARSERILSCVPASGEHLRRLLGQIGLDLDS